MNDSVWREDGAEYEFASLFSRNLLRIGDIAGETVVVKEKR